ncbi:MAG: selenoneine synthase SenA [Candidatus Competibacteraceae bacterium]|jgi:iron(II)-dependent oxidoreductase|nr:selenoneine synthase SenA [Candidatus Competibacteraceae bacterium]
MTQPVSTAHLIEILLDARSRTLDLLQGLSHTQLIGPKLPIVNPMLWEIGHVAWFYEHFILRRLYDYSPLLANGDTLYDSIKIAHDTRWGLPLLSLEDTLNYMEQVHESLIERLDGSMASEQDSFIYQFATFHEDMHDEAFLWTRQTLAYPKPDLALAKQVEPAYMGGGPLPGDVEIPGGAFLLGAAPTDPFLFDNEKWAHPVTVESFKIARAPVTNSEFTVFVEAGGYQRREFWDERGWLWRESINAQHPVYWERDTAGDWHFRRFHEHLPLPPHQPVIHVNWHEANAYCHWAKRRLPTEVEWEAAASGEPTTSGELSTQKRRFPWGDSAPRLEHANLDGRALGCIDVGALPAGDSAFGCRQMLGNVWEWTSDTFSPYPGFAPDAYEEYSQPLFGETKVLRGGAWTTRSRMVNARYRNYFGPERRDVFAGFRTCALADGG